MSIAHIRIKSQHFTRFSVLVILAVFAGVSPLLGAKRSGLRIASVDPTVLFAEDGADLQQLVSLTVENQADPARADLEVTLGEIRVTRDLGLLAQGENALQVYVPDVRKSVRAEFVLRAAGQVQDRHAMAWQPRRHWRVFFVPITHHDLGYTDTIENVLRDFAGFYDKVLEFCDQTRDWPHWAKYRYTLESTWSIQHFLDKRPPEVAQRLGQYIKEGRIEVGALFGNQISGLCGHEELIRLMYPSFRLQREFGAQILCGSITDVPGLSWGLPTVMAGAGVKYFFAGLPTYFEWGRNDIHTFWDEDAILRHGRPDAFRWQGPDGSEVLVYYQGSYGFFERVVGPDSYAEVLEHLPSKLAALEKQNSPFDVMRYIHNGVDNYPPNVSISHIARDWNNTWAYPRLIVATNAMFFTALEEQCQDVRSFRGELPHTDYVVGAISTAKHTSINRLTHDKLLSAEKAATLASLVAGQDYPAQKIRTAYDNMLLYDEHTWGKDYPAGPIQDLAWHEKSHYALRAASLTEEMLSHSLSAIARQIDLPEPRGHIVVFNALSHERTDVVRVTRFRLDKPFELIDLATGQSVPYQIQRLEGPLTPLPYAAYRHARGQFEKHELVDLVFVAEGVPSLGYKTFQLVAVDRSPVFSHTIRAGQHCLENRFFRLVLNPRTGAVQSIYDKGQVCERVDQSAQHGVNQLVGKWVQTGKIQPAQKASIRRGATGPVYASLIVETSGPGCPQVIQEVALYHDIKRIDFANRVLKDSTPLLEIYFAFPFQIDDPKFHFEGSNSVIEPLKDQFPGSNSNYYAVQHWADVSNQGGGIVLSGIDSHLLEFGGLWPCYVSQAHHGFTPPGFGEAFVQAEQLTRGHMYAFVMDSNFRTNFQPVQQGDMLFRYAMTTHKGDWRQGNCRDFGWSVCHPLLGVALNGPRQGPLPRRASFCTVDQSNCLVLTVKRADVGEDLIVRLIETEGKAVRAQLSLPQLKIEKAWYNNLVEDNLGPLRHTDHELTVPMKAFGISTIRIRLASTP